PLLGGMPGVEDLEFQAAARFNDFSTFGTNTTYKMGVRYSPIRDITARATYGTAFRAPNVGELYGGASDDYPSVTDPCGGTTQDPDMCKLLTRDDAGNLLVINDERANLGNYHTTGVDFAVRYAYTLEDFGRFNLILDGTYLNSFRTTDIIGVVDNAAGNYDFGVLPKLKVNAGVFWSMGPFNAGVTGRYVGNFKECASGNCTDDDTQA